MKICFLLPDLFCFRLNLLEGQACDEMLLEFNTGSSSSVGLVVASRGSLVIGARFDLDQNTPACRMAFHGRVGDTFASAEEYRALPVSSLENFHLELAFAY